MSKRLLREMKPPCDMPSAAVPCPWLALAAAVVLLLGVAVYVTDREPSAVYFVSSSWSLAGGAKVFGLLGGQLPQFAHVYAFSLVTALVLGASRPAMLASCGFWAAVDGLFELGQHPVISPHLVAAVPEWFGRVPFLENTVPYLLHGTFDPWDLGAIALGAVAAWGTFRLSREEVNHVPSHEY